VHPITVAIARRIGRIEGEQAALGVAIAFEDLAIGVTALELGFDIATLNIRHFRVIPDLNVMRL
jgi:predicted nucleic acid-binding protein